MTAFTTKAGWDGLPGPLRARIVDLAGSPVADTVTRQGGFTPGVAAQVRFADGTRLFVKAVAASTNADSAAMHRREAEVVAAIGTDEAVPTLRAGLDDGDWVALVFDHARGSHPRVPWGRGPFVTVVTALAALHERLTPSPVATHGLTEHDLFAQGWAEVAAGDPSVHGLTAAQVDDLAALAATAGDHLHGDTLLHGDLRADQILVAGSRVAFVDWPHACTGPAWADLALAVPSLLAADRHLDVDTVAGLCPELAQAPPTAVRALLSIVTGTLLARSLRPPPPGLPTVRAYQRDQALAVLPWLLDGMRR